MHKLHQLKIEKTEHGPTLVLISEEADLSKETHQGEETDLSKETHQRVVADQGEET